MKRVLYRGFCGNSPPLLRLGLLLTPCARSDHPLPVDIRHFTPIDAIGVFLNDFTIFRILRGICERLRTARLHVSDGVPENRTGIVEGVTSGDKENFRFRWSVSVTAGRANS